PHNFADPAQGAAVLSLTDQDYGKQICTEVFDGRMGFVPYFMPGFGLAKKAIEVFEGAPDCDGLILSKHGLVTFGDTAQQAYERMIGFVSRAEEFIARKRKSVTAVPSPPKTVPLAQVAPIVRGACSEQDDTSEGAWRRLVLEFRTSEAALDFLNSKNLRRLSEAGVITPDHTIRTKNWPLLLDAPQSEGLTEFAQATQRKAQAF